MPCDQVVRTTVNFENIKAEDPALLVAALEAEGYAVRVVGGTLTATHPRHGTLTWDAKSGAVRQESTGAYGQTAQDVNELKVAYSKKVVAKVATRFGWTLKQKESTSEAVAVAFSADKRGF